jgi:hypothetical protein
VPWIAEEIEDFFGYATTEKGVCSHVPLSVSRRIVEIIAMTYEETGKDSLGDKAEYVLERRSHEYQA